VAFDPSPPSRAQVLQLMAAMGVQQRVDNSLKAAQLKVKEAARVAFQKNYPDAPPAALKKLDAIFDGTPLFSFEDISEPLIAVYEKNLSAADVQAGIDFYSSPSGRHLLEKLPVIQRDTNATGGPLVQQKLTDFGDQIERKLSALREELGPPRPAEKKPAESKPEEKK
jgi:hypothetical protein